MTSAVAEPSTEQETPADPAVPVSEAEKGTSGLFKYSAYIHVGEGAEECEQRETGKCQDGEHFHAWVRLANQFQMRDIQEKANAAKARRIRALRDPESDARVILEEELERLAATGLKSLLIDEIIDRDFQEIYVEAVKAVDDIDADSSEVDTEDDEESEPAKKFATIDQDREEYARLVALPEEQRGEDFEPLKERVAAHSRAIDEERQRIIALKREPLEERPMADLVDIVRHDRINNAGAEAYLNAFNTWHWFVCTLKPTSKGRPSERVFRDYNAMRFEADPEVINALDQTFNDLEGRLAHSRAVGKS